MTTPTGVLKAKRLVAGRGPALVVVFALVAVASFGSAGWLYAHPATTEVTDHVDKQTVRSELHTAARVTGNSSFYDRGTTLRDEPLYLVSASPIIELSARTDLPTEQAVDVTQTVDVVLRARRDGTVFWSETPVTAHNDATVTNGTVVTTATIDGRQLRERKRELERELGPAGSVDAVVRVTVEYDTGRYSNTERDTTSIQFTGRSVSVGDLSIANTHSRPVTRTVPLPQRSATSYGLLAGLGVIALIVAGLTALEYHRGGTVEGLDRRLQQRRYDEWITPGALPVGVGTSRISVASVEHLVDVAIDTGKRVIHDTQRGVYGVVDGEVVYYYSPDGWTDPAPGGATDDDTDGGTVDDRSDEPAEETRVDHGFVWNQHR